MISKFKLSRWWRWDIKEKRDWEINITKGYFLTNYFFFSLQIKPKNVRRKKSQIKFTPLTNRESTIDSLGECELISLRDDNNELIERIADLERDCEIKEDRAKMFSDEKIKLEESLKVNEKKLKSAEVSWGEIL